MLRAGDGSPHALPGLANRSTREPDDVECGEPGFEGDLNLDRSGLHSDQGNGRDAGDHSREA